MMTRIHWTIFLLIAVVGLFLFVGTPAHSATLTTSAQLEALAKTLENAPPSATNDKALLTLLREPAKTLDGVTLSTTAAQYTKTIDTALKLQPDPTHWFATGGALPGWLTPGTTCGVTLAYWRVEDKPATFETFVLASGKATCAGVLSAAIARAWAYKLKQIGR